MAQQSGNLFSAASAPIEGANQRSINSNNPAWAHCFCPNIAKKHHLQCKYCDKICSGGITRMKYHLARIKGFNTAKCPKVLPPVQQEMFNLLSKKTGEKEQKKKEKEIERAEVNIENSDCESGSEGSDHGNKVLVVKPKATRGSNSSRSVVGGHTIDKYYTPPSVEESASVTQRGINLSKKVQTALTTQKREERRDKTCEYICQWFYEASIPHHTVTLPSFDNMLEAIGQFAIRQRKNKNFNPAKWWLNHGTTTPNLRKLAARILSLTCSSSARAQDF